MYSIMAYLKHFISPYVNRNNSNIMWFFNIRPLSIYD